jgi:hypothetical protein
LHCTATHWTDCAIGKNYGNVSFAIEEKYWTHFMASPILGKSRTMFHALIQQCRRSSPMSEINVSERKQPQRAAISADEKLLVGRHEAAEMLSISRRALDYLVASNQLAVRHIGARVLIQVADLKRFSRADHPARLAG